MSKTPALLVACVLCNCVLACLLTQSVVIRLVPSFISSPDSLGTICPLQASHQGTQAADAAPSIQVAQQHKRPAFGAATASVTTKPWIGHPAVQSTPSLLARASFQHQVMTAKDTCRWLRYTCIPVNSLSSETNIVYLACVVCRRGLCYWMTMGSSTLRVTDL